MMKVYRLFPLLSALIYHSVAGFVQHLQIPRHSFILKATTSESSTASLQSSVDSLKKVLEREYASFFDPMERVYYSPQVTFDDPLNDLEGIDSYQKNVDMLAARTLLGQLLFSDAGIVLHSIKGGEIQDDGSISNIITRWTLRMTAKVLPWKPTARFSGISEYTVQKGGPQGVQIMHQADYWDSINLIKGGTYQQVDKGKAVQDFLNQLKPEEFNAPSAAPELPYQLLRRGKDYEVRRYPSFTAAQVPYQRRDEALSILGSLTTGMNPLAPALMQVPQNSDASKTMMWPLTYAAPGTSTATPPALPKDNNDAKVLTMPEQVVAVARFSDASVEPVVRRADQQLRAALERDGIAVAELSNLQFAQYDAIYSMGKRRGEVWIPLAENSHPWSN